MFKNKKAVAGPWSVGAIIAPSILLFIGWLFVAGIIGWNKQIQWIVLIGAALFILMRKK